MNRINESLLHKPMKKQLFMIKKNFTFNFTFIKNQNSK